MDVRKSGFASGRGAGLILGIESSCDETAAAVVERGSRTLASVVASQIPVHARFGGVVPELASREHLRNIVPVVDEALARAGCSWDELDAIAVTSGPGLAGALLVGILYAKALAFARGLPLVAVNHLEGHIHAVLLEERMRDVEHEFPLPALALVVSGGHTHMYLARPVAESWRYTLVGRTVDDAAGEAFDKVAKLLGLGYPGGPWMDALARFGRADAVEFKFGRVKEKAHITGPRAAVGKNARVKGAKTAPLADLDARFLFSFSGLKTAVLRYVELNGLREGADVRAAKIAAGARVPETHAEALELCSQSVLDLIASFQHAVVGDLMKKAFAAAESFGAASLLVTGGVAANRELRVRFTAEAAERGLPVAFPSLALATDNAAMIAAAAWPRFVAGEVADWELSASPALALGR